MRFAPTILLAASLISTTVAGDEPNSPSGEHENQRLPIMSSFDYSLSLTGGVSQGYVIAGRINGLTTKANVLRFRAESPDRVPGDAAAKFVAFKTTVKDGVIDAIAVKEYIGSGMPAYPPDKPAASFRIDLRHLIFIGNEARLRIRFSDATQHYLLRFEEGKGLILRALDADSRVQLKEQIVPEFAVVQTSEEEITWSCNPLTTAASAGGKLAWSTDVQMEGQPRSISIVGDLLFVTTTADHSFYLLKKTGELAFYDKTVMQGKDPIEDVLTIGFANMKHPDKRRSLARFIYAAVILNDRRAIPFLIECVESGDGIPVKTMAVAALEHFNGNPEAWKPRDPETGLVNFQMTPMSRVFPAENRQAEIDKWREVFEDELRE